MSNKGDFLFYSSVDDELYEELQQLIGQKIVYAAVWDDSLADALTERSEHKGAAPAQAEEYSPACDIDLYLEDGVYFELYSVTSFKTLDGDPLPDCTRVEESIRSLLKENASLGDVAVDENDALVLVLNRGPNPALYLAVGGWVLEEWDELPV